MTRSHALATEPPDVGGSGLRTGEEDLVRDRPLGTTSILALALAVTFWASPAGATLIACLEGFRAVTLALESVVSQTGEPDAILVGRIRVEAGTLPLVGPTSFEIVEVDATGSGGTVRLDPEVASAGLGVLAPDGTFLVPTLFLRVGQGGVAQDLAVANVTGSVELDPICGNTITDLAASFEVDSGDAEGPLAVAVVATPEPDAAALGAAAALALALCRRARRSAR